MNLCKDVTTEEIIDRDKTVCVRQCSASEVACWSGCSGSIAPYFSFVSFMSLTGTSQSHAEYLIHIPIVTKPIAPENYHNIEAKDSQTSLLLLL